MRVDPPDTKLRDVVELDLSSLLDTTLVTASKRQESLLDSPHSASVITRAQIARSSARTIPEALRLVPGVIVREVAPGVYDVHLRGFTRLLPAGLTIEQTSRLVLVMIDDRIVHSDFWGGTFWETLPVSLDDVESIEVVRGPVSALYGLNAVAGVIHIITRRPISSGASARAEVRTGAALRSRVVSRTADSASVGVSYGNAPFSASVSAMLSHHIRPDRRYFSVLAPLPGLPTDRIAVYERPDDIPATSGLLAPTANPREAYPEPQTSLRTFATNLHLGYSAPSTDGPDLQLRAGTQRSLSHASVFEYPPAMLTMMDSETSYLHLTATARGFVANAAVALGEQGVPSVELYRWRFRTSEAALEYELSLGDTIVRPGIQARHLSYEGTLFGTTVRPIFHYAASLRVDQSLLERIRLVAACRLESNSDPSGWYLPWTLSATYVIGDSTVLRATVGRAFRGPAAAELFFNVDRELATSVRGRGNPDITLTHVDSAELGVRSQIFDHAFGEAELFASRLGDVYAVTGNFSSFEGAVHVDWKRTAITARAVGAMLAGGASFGVTDVRVFTTAQHVRFEDSAAAYLPAPRGLQRSRTDEASPKLYGGFIVDYQRDEAFSASIIAYGFAAHSLSHTLATGPKRVPGKSLLDVALRYRLTPGLCVQAAWKNALLQRSREYLGSDHIGSMVMLSVAYEPEH